MTKLFLICVLFLTLCCTGCYWRLRNPSEVPPQLKVCYLDAKNLDNHFNLQLLNLLESMKISLVKAPQMAALTLRVYDYHLKHNTPPASSTNIAITYTYTLTVAASITDSHGRVVVPPHIFTTSRDVTVNTSQLFAINSTTIFEQELQRETITLIYYWMTSDKTHKLLSHSGRVPLS